MNDRQDSATAAVSVPMDSGPGMNASFGVAAPVGAVGRKERLRAGNTSLLREGDSTFLLHTAVPGSVALQRKGTDGTWDTLSTVQASRVGRTPIELPTDPSPAARTFRVVFSPRNSNLPSWVSDALRV